MNNEILQNIKQKNLNLTIDSSITDNVNIKKNNYDDINNNSDIEIMGLEINEYSKKYNITLNQIWKEIKTGKLVARSEKGKIFVYGTTIPNNEITDNQKHYNTHTDNENIHNTSQSFVYPVSSDNIQQLNLPPLDQILDDESQTESTSKTLTKNTLMQMSLAINILTEHIKISKEQQQNLMKLTQNYINHLTQMSEKIISLKDQCIEEQAKTILLQKEENLNLKKTINSLEEENKKLKQQIEDLEILTKMINTN